MKYALIGCGRISAHHIRAALDNRLEISAICDISTEAMSSLLDKFAPGGKKSTPDLFIVPGSVKQYTDYRQLVDENPDLQLVAVATESGTHAEIASYVIKHGINVIIEKPIAMSIADADKIIELSKKYNVKVCANHQNRFNGAVQAMRGALENGKFGILSNASMCVRWKRDEKYYSQAEWRGKWASDGGTLMNQCIHGIDLLRWMMGDDIDEVYGQTRRRMHNYIEGEDVGVAVVKFKNGAVATIEGTINVPDRDWEETLTVIGNRGICRLGGICCDKIDSYSFEEGYIPDVKDEIVENVYGNGHSRLYADMIDAIKNDRQPYVDAEVGKRALELVLAIYKSQKEQRPVRLPLEDFSSADMAGEFDKS